MYIIRACWFYTDRPLLVMHVYFISKVIAGISHINGELIAGLLNLLAYLVAFAAVGDLEIISFAKGQIAGSDITFIYIP